VVGDESPSQFKIAISLSIVVAVSGREDKSDIGEGRSFILKMQVRGENWYG
jgi:hypothetical protein